MSDSGLAAALDKMRAADVHPVAMRVFTDYYRQLDSGATGLLAEADLAPLPPPQRLADLPAAEAAARAALAATVVIKVNGGLGTSMGMDRAKSLLEVRDGLSFLDITVRQVLAARRHWDVRLPLLFMDSFRTQDDTLVALQSYPELAVDGLPLDFLQNQQPKLRADDLAPVTWQADPELEWCPPGHGDLYPALLVSGVLSKLLAAGYRHAFVSNADNLCAGVDGRLAAWFADSDAPCALEVCRRTPADRKGGHLAVRASDGRLVLREIAQTDPADAAAFADIERHRYFNTNSMWLDLVALADRLAEGDGVLHLPLIRNSKTVDPADPTSIPVIQIESAMGAAVEVFDGSTAVEVDRARFRPVKSTNDLLLLRSDVYRLTEDFDVVATDSNGALPEVDLDDDFYRLIGEFDRRFPAGPPSLKDATSLRVRGDWTFAAGVVVEGDARVDSDGAPGTVPPSVLGRAG
ncbi:MAG: UTP--glucose-1-phosphate uridylyltransferase [Mycobacteriales bacterium]